MATAISLPYVHLTPSISKIKGVKLKGASSLSVNSSSMKESGLASRIPRLRRKDSVDKTGVQSVLPLSNIPQISVGNTKDDDHHAHSLAIKEERLKRRHSVCVRGSQIALEKGCSGSPCPSCSPFDASSDTLSPLQQGRLSASVKRHKSFSAGERPNFHVNKNQRSSIGLQSDKHSSSPVPSVTSRLNTSSELTSDYAPSPNFLSRQSQDNLLLGNTPSPDSLYYRNTYQTLTLPGGSPPPPVAVRRRNSFAAEAIMQEGVISSKSGVKTAAVFDPGRVQVFVRVRPPNDTEDLSKFPSAVSVPDEEETQLKLIDGKNDRCYQFDGVFQDSASNKQVFKTVGEPLVYSALSGFNGILMCYGQTGTGKTYTLMSNDGMSVRIVYQCFKVLNKDKRHKYTVTCSYLQIYQEKIFDLLNETRTVELSLREHPKTGVYIENLTEYVVHSPKEVLNLLKVGKRRLVFAETKMNRASSRSHAICQLKILKERIGSDSGSNHSSPPLQTQTPELDDEDVYFDSHDQLGQSINESYQLLTDDSDDEDILSNVPELEDGVTSVRGKLYICDLAGSERIKKTKASGERLQEAQHINSSLLELGNVIQALAEGKRSHVPFRNSTLTRLLQEGLSGNCKTRLVVCVAPTVRDVHETKCSLNFGSRAMKIQVMAHVNYEVDYKKLAEALAAKLENLEQDWNLQKQNYDKFIKHLKNEIDTRRSASPMEPHIVGVKSPAKHVQSLLVVELMTLQLFYNLQSSWSDDRQKGQMHISQLSFTSPNLDLMLQSMEGLLELLSDYLRDRIPFRSKNYSTSSGCSSVITSPDCIDQSVSSTYDVPSTLEPVARFLEHAQITKANLQSNLDKRGVAAIEQSSKERLRRVVNSLMQVKELVSKKTISHLKDTFAGALKDSGKSMVKLNSLEEIVNRLESEKDLLRRVESIDDVQSLENSLYYLLMDKALLSCMVLIKSHSTNLFDNYKVPSDVGNFEPEIKQILEELTLERNARDKAQIELYTVRQDQIVTEEKLKDVQLELKAIRELRENLETKVNVAEKKNRILEEQIIKFKKEKEALETRIQEIEKRKLQLESSLKNSDNNNARKERLIVDLKNEKVALDSLVSTLKEEISILEKERVRESDEKRKMEEELEDVRDRNIILETEWSCCREENGLLETELTALEEDKAMLEDELSKYREDVKMLEEAVNMLEAQTSDYKQDILSLKGKEERLLSSLRVEKEKFTKEINSLKQELSTLRVERRRFQRDISASRTDKSNTERAYNALKSQKDSLQEDVSSFKQVEKRLQREISVLKTDRSKLDREIHSLKNENMKLKQEISHADKIKVELKLLHKNEERIAVAFKIEKDRLYDNLLAFKEKYERMEQDFAKVCTEKEKLIKQLKRYEQTINDKNDANTRRSQSQPTHAKSVTPEKAKIKQYSSVQGALVRRSVTSGEVSEIEGKVLDLQRRLAFFMTEKEEIQKELISSREKNTKLTSELKTLEADTSKIQILLSKLMDEKESLQTNLVVTSQSKEILEKEQIELKKAVDDAQAITLELRGQLDDVSDQNRALEVDYITIKESAKMLQGEKIILNTENEHMKKEISNMDNELKQTRCLVKEFNTKLDHLKAQVKEAGEKESALKDKVSSLQTQNMSLSEQVTICQQEEEVLVQSLSELNEKFKLLQTTVEQVCIEKQSDESQLIIEEILEKLKKLKEQNVSLEETVNDLRSQLELVVMDAEQLKEEREEIEKIIQDDDNVMKDRQNGTEKSLVENIRNLWLQLQKVKAEKSKVDEKMGVVEKQLLSLGQENETLTQSMKEKSLRLEKEKRTYQLHIDQLQQQIEELVKEKINLEAQILFLKSQNDELRRGIAVLLEDNSKLEAELDVVEEEFDNQEKELDSANEETKELLRQLCAAETKNLNLCTVQSSHQEDLEKCRKQIEMLTMEKEEFNAKHLESEMKQKTLQERLLMAELEISKLKSEHASVEGQRRLLVDDLDAADRERNMLKTELHGLARALSPLKKEVTEVIKKQESLKHEVELKSQYDVSSEVARIKDDLSVFNREKTSLEVEQCALEVKLKVVGREKEDLRIKLRELIQDLDEQSKLPLADDLSEISEPIQIVSKLIMERQELEIQEKILSDDLIDAQYSNNILNICLDNSTNELRTAQEQLCLSTIDRLKLKDKTRNIDKTAADLRYGASGYKTKETAGSPLEEGGMTRKTGISPLQHEVSKLKLDIEQFEKSQEHILHEIRSLNDQLNVAENNLFNVVHFKRVIEKNLREYKERNSKLESHLRVIYNDLLEMESHLENPPSDSAKLLLETLDLQTHFQSLEDDLCDSQTRNRTLKEDASNLMERYAVLQEEKQLNTGSGLWSAINKK